MAATERGVAVGAASSGRNPRLVLFQVPVLAFNVRDETMGPDASVSLRLAVGIRPLQQCRQGVALVLHHGAWEKGWR